MWIVAKTKMRSVSASSPAASATGSSTPSWKLVSPPYPIQRAIGSMKSSPDLVGEPAEPQVVVPGRLPAILDLRHRHPGRAVRREQAELEVGAVEQCFCHGVSFVQSGSGKAAHLAAVHHERRALGHGRGDDAADEDDVVAAVVLGVHRRTRSWRQPRRGSARRSSPRPTSRPSNFSAPCARTARRAAPDRRPAGARRIPAPRARRRGCPSCGRRSRARAVAPARRAPGSPSRGPHRGRRDGSR